MFQRAKLLFDSASAGARVGLRGLAHPERSLLFSGAALAVELVAFEARGGVQVLHGQVLDSSAERPVPGARVALGDDGDVVVTDPFGEFSLSTLGPLSASELRVETGATKLRCIVPGAGPAGKVPS